MADPLTIARQSLVASRTAESVLTRNAAEMQDPNAIKKVVDYTAENIGIKATVRESINESLMTASRETLLKAAETSVKHASAAHVESFVGGVGENRSIAHTCANLASQFQALANTDGISFGNAKNTTYVELSSFVEKNKTFANEIQKERDNANHSIADKLTLVNESLKLLAAANERVLVSVEGEFSAVEQQRSALNELSKYLDVYARLESDGKYTVYSDIGGSQRLVYDNIAAEFSYDDNTVVTPSSSFNPIILNVNGSSIDVTDILKNGKGEIAADLYVRDIFTPALQKQLDQATTQIVTEFNRVHNLGTSTVLRSTIAGDGIPGAATITGAETLIAGRGTVRFALIDSDHKLNSGTGDVTYKDIDLSGFAGGDINAFVTFLNGQLVPGGGNDLNIVASVNGDGQFQLTTSDSSLGIAVGELASPASNVELNTGENASFADFFGLNNLLTNTLQSNDVGYTQQVKIRSDIIQNTGEGISAGALTIKTPPTTHDAALFGTNIARQLALGLTGQNMSFGVTDTLGAKSSSIQEYFISVVGNLSSMTKNFEHEMKIAVTSHVESTKLIERISKTTHKEVQDGMMDLALFQQMMLKVLASSLTMRDALFEVA